ncbi:MAG: hypothetical protein ABSG76_20570 [Xanthobacteraceae bacterium]|jgi:hypothetical protein
MRSLTAAIVIGALMLIGTLPAAAGQSTVALGWEAPVRLAGGDLTAERETYNQVKRGEMRKWQHKIDDFNQKAEAAGGEPGSTVEGALTRAWTNAQVAAADLQTAGPESWESAKISFEKASRDLADIWSKIQPQNKTQLQPCSETRCPQ